MLVSADIPKPAKPRACAVSAQAVRELLQAGPSCLNTVITAGSHLLLITGGRQGAIWGDSTVTHSAHPSLAFSCSLSLQHRGALTVNWCSYFSVTGWNFCCCCSLWVVSVRRFFTLTPLSILVFLLCSLFPSFIQKSLVKDHFWEKKQKNKVGKKMSTKSLSLLKSIFQKPVCKTREVEGEKFVVVLHCIKKACLYWKAVFLQRNIQQVQGFP